MDTKKPLEVKPEDVNAWDNMTRTDNDLDSIESGAPTKGGKIKLYFDTRKDTLEELQVRADLALGLLAYVNSNLEGNK